MKRSTIVQRACVVGAGVALLALAALTPAWANPGTASGGCCDLSQTPPNATGAQYPYSNQGNPMDFQGLTSPEQNADEGTLHQGPAQVDAEVGAGESDVAEVPRAARGAEGDWVTQGLVMVLALAIVSLGLRFIFLPSDRIPRIGSATSRSDG